MSRYRPRSDLEEAIQRRRAQPPKQKATLTFEKALTTYRSFDVWLKDGLHLYMREDWYDDGWRVLLRTDSEAEPTARFQNRFGAGEYRVFEFKHSDMPALLAYIAAVGGVTKVLDALG